MLGSRVTTALILIPIMLGGIFLLPLDWFAGFIGFIAVLGAWEWGRLSGLDGRPARAVYALLVVGVLAGLFALVRWPEVPLQALLIGSALCWLAGLILVMSYPKSRWAVERRRARLVMGLLVLGSMWLGFYGLRQAPSGDWLVLLLMLLVWGADIGAYYAGRRFGRHKLAPAVSPGKTWEGVAGGILGASMLALALVLFLFPATLSGWVDVLLLALLAGLVVLASIVGDLVESLAKRTQGCKDSGTLLPGHGGVLDRIDSMCAAAPVMAAYLSLWPAL